jgi:hypothetical protein
LTTWCQLDKSGAGVDRVGHSSDVSVSLEGC